MKKHPHKTPHPEGRPHRRPRFPREVAILYEDESLVALDKPPGLLAVPVKGTEAESALSLLAAELRSRRERAFVVHRIDRFASGILLFAKTEAARDALVRQFLKHRPVRQYLAVVRGHPARKEGTLVHHLQRQGMFQKLRREHDPQTARAELSYRVERTLRGASLVRITLGTGLQNQIRVQFAAIGHPVVGDRKYSPDEATEHRINRVALHAARLEFVHPQSGERIVIDSKPPTDFQSLVKALGPPGGEK
jgi:23S rRNA pseudouridine1911/1915/1917 synthase